MKSPELKDQNRIKIRSGADKKGLSSNYYPFAICLTRAGAKKGREDDKKTER